MFEKFFNALETPNHSLLGPNLKILKFAGLLQPTTGMKKHVHNLIHVGVILFVVSQYMELYIIRSDLDSALKNLSTTSLSAVSVIKVGTFVFWNRKWQKILNWISKIELKLKAKNDNATEMVMNDYRRYSRKITYFYWTLVYLTLIAVILTPLFKYISDADYREKIRNHEEPYPEILSSWLPFDKSRSFGYVFYILEHIFLCYYGGSIIASYDTNAVVVMTFFAGQLKLLRMDCSRIFQKDKTAVSEKLALLNIRDCHKRHTELIMYAKLFDSLLSPVMFVYLIVCSIMICSSAIQLTKEGTTKMQQIWIAEYFLSLIAQLFLFCWHSNQVFFMGKEVDRGVYESEWWNQGVRLRRCILLLAGKLGRKIIFTAGPFTDLTIATFVVILKGSYNYYVILRNNAESEKQ